MEKGEAPPGGMPAPPYPGPPMGAYQSQPAVSYAPQPGFAHNQPVIVQPVSQTVLVQQLPDDAPGQMLCPHCQSMVVTQTDHKNGLLTWLVCAGLGIFLCWPCCFIPFCVESCKDVEHTCPRCHNVLHIHKRL